MKAKKLPSGMWNMTIYSHMEGNKRKYASFTANTKAEAELMAAEFKASKKRRVRHDLTVNDAVTGYISSKEGVLSPETIRGYLKIQRNNIEFLKNKKIRELNTEIMQRFVSDLSAELSPKSVRNIYGLVRASVSMYAPDLFFRVTKPAKQKRRPESPSDADVKALYAAATPRMKVRIALASLGLRRGEMCAVKYEDIQGDMLHVHADLVQNKNNEWIYKEVPKTSDSDRFVKLPPTVLELIGEGHGYIVNVKPPAVTLSFIRLRDKVGINSRLHDMRHFFASTAVLLKIPDIYAADLGGWDRNSSTLKTVYQNNIRSMSDYYQNQITSHMDSLINAK